MPGIPIAVVSEHNGQSLARAVDGEINGMDSGDNPLGPLLTEAFSRAELGKDAVWGQINGGRGLEMAAGGSNSSFTLTIAAFSCLATYNGTKWKTFAYAGGTIGASKVSPAGNLANSTVYYVYAYNNGGSLDFQITTDVPNANLRFKNASSQYVYVGWFVTDSAGAPLPFIMRNGHYRFLFGALTSSSAHRVITAGNATSFTAVTVACVPAHARLIRLHFELTPGAAGRAVYFRAGGTSTFHKYFVAQATYAVLGDTAVELNSSRQFEYKVSNSGDSLETYVTEVDE